MNPTRDINKLERLEQLWKSNRIYKWLMVIIIANFIAFAAGTIVFGGDAVSGKKQDGHYYLYGYSTQMATTVPMQEPKDVYPLRLGYGDVDWNDERGFLDNIANNLQSSPQSYVLAVFYGGPKSCRMYARRRAIRASKYLAKKWKIASKQFVWKDGGFEEQAKVEAILLPNSINPGELTSFSHPRPPKPEWKIKNCK